MGHRKIKTLKTELAIYIKLNLKEGPRRFYLQVRELLKYRYSMS